MSSGEAKNLSPKSRKSHEVKTRQCKDKSKEISETSPHKHVNFPEVTDSAILETSVVTLDHEDAVGQCSIIEPKDSFANVLRSFLRKQTSKGRTPLLDTRKRFLSLDSSNIFQKRSRNSNRRRSWYGGNIRNSSIKKYPSVNTKPVEKTKRRSSRTSIGTLDSDGSPVRCGVQFDVQVDVHRTASGAESIPAAPEKSPQAKPKGWPKNVTIDVDGPSAVGKVDQNVSHITVDKAQLYELNGKFCKGWLQVIDKITSLCPSWSGYVGPVLITVSLCAGFVIGITLVLFFTWLVRQIGYWWS